MCQYATQINSFGLRVVIIGVGYSNQDDYVAIGCIANKDDFIFVGGGTEAEFSKNRTLAKISDILCPAVPTPRPTPSLTPIIPGIHP